MRRVRRVSISSELLMCGGGGRSILALSLVARCQETIYVCIWRIFVFVSVIVTVWGSVGTFVVQRPLLKIVFLALECCKYIVCLCKGCDGCCVFGLYWDAWSCSMSVSSCRCCMLLLFAFQSMFISIWVSRLEIAEFPDSVRRSAP